MSRLTVCFIRPPSTRRRVRVIVALSAAILLAAAQAVSAYPFSARGFELLPRHCKAWYAQMLTTKRKPELSQIGPDAVRKYRVAYWKKQMGKGWTFANHYCPGVLRLTRNDRQIWYGIGLENDVVQRGVPCQVIHHSAVHIQTQRPRYPVNRRPKTHPLYHAANLQSPADGSAG